MTEKFDHDAHKAEDKRRVDEKQGALVDDLAAAAPAPEPFKGRAVLLATLLHARNINVVAGENFGADGVKLTLGTPTGDRVYELEGRYSRFPVALAIFGGTP